MIPSRPLVSSRWWRGALLLIAWCGLIPSSGSAAPAHFVLEVEMANVRGGSVQLFYNVGDGYSARDVADASLPAGATLQPLRFELPAQPIFRLRLDPDAGEAIVRIGQLRLLNDRGDVLKSFGPECLRPMGHIRSLTFAGGVATVATAADDPMLLIDEPLQAVSQQALGRQSVSRSLLGVLGLLTALALLFAIAAAARAIVADGSATAERQPVIAARPWFWFAGSILLVFGARLVWLKLYSRPMPVTDEWDADALFLLMPLQGGFLDWSALFRPHAEHRIFVTRLITLVGTILNGEWDPRVAMVVSATLFTTLIALVSTAALQIGRRAGLIAAAAILALASMPYDAANIFWGFQSQMFALTLTAVGVISIAVTASPGPSTWLIAVAAGAVSLLTMGSGFVGPAVAAVIASLRWLGERDRRRSLDVLMLACFAVAIAGWLMRSESRWHAPSYSHSVAEFGRAFVLFGSWPLPPHALSVVLVWIPWLVQASAVLRFFRQKTTPLDWLAFGLGLWALINVVGLAHGRPYETAPLDSRFHTVLSIGGFASVLSTGALLRRGSVPRWLVGLLAAMSLTTVIGVGVHGFHGVSLARHQLEAKNGYDSLIRAYLRTGERRLMEDVDPAKSPYWNSADLAARLDSPLLQPMLPAPFRRELAVRPEHPFTGSTEPGPLTLAARTLMKLSPALVALGCALLGLALRPVRGSARASGSAALFPADEP